MISIPDIGHVYPKGDVDIRFDTTPRFVSTGSAYFDGSNDFVNCGDHPNSQMASGDFSVCYWTKNTLPDSTGDESFVVSKQDGASDYDGYRFGQDDGVTVFTLRVDGSNDTGYVKGNTKINDGVWHHIAFTVDRSGNLLGYVDGQLDKTTDISSISGSIDPDEDLILGASYAGANQLYAGNLCNVGIYKGTVLTQAQVRSIMAATTYAQTAAVVTPSLFYLLAADYTDSTGNQDATNVGSILVGERARLPNGYDLSMTAGVPNQMNAQCFSGRAIDLDGTGDYISLAHPSDLDGFFNTGGTISMWINMTSTATFERLFDFSGGTSFYLQGSFSGYIFNKDFSTTDGVWTYNGNGGVGLGEWFHFCLSYNAASTSNNPDLYINGVLQAIDGETAPVGSAGADTTEKLIGIAADKSASPLDASLADIKLFTSTVTAAQALEMYQNPEQILPTGIASSALKCWLPCSDYDIATADNSLNGLYAQDASGNGNHGALTNCGMIFSQPSPLPQLGLRSSSSRVYLSGGSSEEALSVAADSDINGLFHDTPGGTISFWCFTNSAGGGSSGRLMDNVSSCMRIALQSDTGTHSKISVYCTWTGDSINVKTSSAVFEYGVWNHVVVSYNPGTQGSPIPSNRPVLYLNNSAVSMTSGADPGGSYTPADDDADKVFGNDVVSGGVRCWDGIISEIAMWKTAMDADAVAVLYAGGQGFDLSTDSGNYDVSSSLKAWYAVDNPVTCTDLTGNTAGVVVANSPNMATAPGGSTEGLSVMGTLTSSMVGSSKINLPVQIDSATQFSGYLKHPCPTWGTDEWCVAFWFRTNYFNGSTPYFWDIRGTANSYGMRIYASGTSGILWKPKGADSGEVAIHPAPASGTITDGAWHFVALQRLGATSQKWHFRRITDASFNTGTNSTGFGDMTDAGTAVINGSSGATSPSGGQLAMPRIYIGESFSDSEIGNMFEQGKRFLIGDS